MRCRPTELLLLAVLLAPAGAFGASTGARATPTELPDLAAATTERAAFGTYVAGCAAALAPADRGLARVARVCYGVDVVLADGPFASSLPEHWAVGVDVSMLEHLRDVARSFDAAPGLARTLRRDALDAELRELRGDFRPPVGLWERLAAWYEELTRRREEEDDPAWLRALLSRLGLDAEDGRWLEITLYVAALALVLTLLVAEARAHGWWARLRALAGRREVASPPPAVAGSLAARDAGDPVAELARRFGTRLGELHAAGHVPRPLTITCRELARLAGAERLPALADVARVAPVVEAARYAPRRPSPAEIDAALALLATSAAPGGASA